MKYALKPLVACMASLFGIAPFNAWGAPPATPPAQNQNAIGTQQDTSTPGTPPVLPSRVIGFPSPADRISRHSLGIVPGLSRGVTGRHL